MMNYSNGTDAGSSNRSFPNQATILSYQGSQPPGHDLTHSTTANSSVTIADRHGGDDGVIFIVVASLIPLILWIIVVAVIACVLRRRNRVRVLKVQENIKVRKLIYEGFSSSATTVQKNAETCISSGAQRFTGLSDHDRSNSVYEIDMGYQYYGDEDGGDKEDHADKEFRFKKKWLFKHSPEDDDDLDVHYENVEIRMNGKSEHTESQSSYSDDSDFKAIMSGLTITPFAKTKTKRSFSTSSSCEDRSVSTVSLCSQDSNDRARGRRERNSILQKDIEKSKNLHFDEVLLEPRTIRSHSLTINYSDVNARPRSFSDDPFKSARKVSLRTENKLDTPDFTLNSLSAGIVDVIVRRGSLDDSIVSSLLSMPLEKRGSFTSPHILNSNHHLVTDLDESNHDDDSGQEMDNESVMSTDIKYRNKDFDLSSLEFEDVEAALLRQCKSNKSAVRGVRDQHDKSLTTENNSDDILNSTNSGIAGDVKTDGMDMMVGALRKEPSHTQHRLERISHFSKYKNIRQGKLNRR